MPCPDTAADAGDTTAMINLGVMHANGFGTPKDEAKAIEWYTKAARLDDADAQEQLRTRGLTW